ncbi:Bug family tripartite tricarboxylate transporter substrate binding protein [Actinophytocola oryzae]|uniref:Tripartite-type tricarboxylate transporter receptor subunit TctC n=1 Tax=Actinophytocola oryzae TaxID=502181 RepID=A0A4R7W6U2_9PSEU|nr:hypothetical protein [Actinophytocola oryzae]TDV57749.1 tripartite-type tricarboxylate transporter receptor subunit TctC [Actinophytocola oryzae]
MLQGKGARWLGGRTRRARLVALTTIVAFTLTACGADFGGESSGDGPYYDGKKIKLLVPFAPGGGADTTARLLAPLLQQYIPGNPSVYVENRGGAGGITGANYFAEREPHDGTTILVSSGATHSSYVVQDPAVKFEFADMIPLFGVPAGAAIYVRSDTGITKPEGIVGGAKVPLVFAGQAPSGGDLRKLLAMDLLKVDYKPLFGYEGAADANIAFDRNEANVALIGVLPYLKDIVPRVKGGEVVPIMSTGLVQDGKLERMETLPDLMTPAELYESIYDEKAEGPGWEAYNMLVSASDSLSKALWLHKDAPDAAVKAVKEGIDKFLADPGARKKLDDELQGAEPLTGDKLTSAIDAMAKPDQAARKWLQDYLVDRWDYKF